MKKINLKEMKKWKIVVKDADYIYLHKHEYKLIVVKTSKKVLKNE